MSEFHDDSDTHEAPLPPPSLGEELNYLQAFNTGILNLVPDGVAVLDDQLSIRSANDTFRELMGLPGAPAERIVVADHPLFRTSITWQGIEKPLGEALCDLFDGGGEIPVTTMSVTGGDGGEASLYAVRASAWDSEDRVSSRILLWIHRKEEGGGPEAQDVGEDSTSEEESTLFEFARGLLEDIPIAVCELAPGLFLRKTNRAVEKIFGRRFRFDPGNEDHIFSVLPELCCDTLLELFEKTTASSRPAGGVIILVRPGGREVRLFAEVRPPIGDDDSTFLFLQPESMATFPGNTDSTRAGGEETSTAIDALFSRSFPFSDPQEDEPVNEEVQNVLTAVDLILDFERLTEKVLDMGLDLTDGASGSLMLVTSSGRELSIACARGLADPIARTARQRIGEGIAGSVAEKGEPLLLQGRIGDKRFRGVGGRPEIHSSVCVPILSDRKVLGVLNINSRSDAPPFTDEQLRQVAALGRQVGPALERSRELKKARRRSFELTVRAEIESIKFSTGTLGAKLEQVSERIGALLDFDICSIYLKEGDRDFVTLRATAGMKGNLVNAVSIPTGAGHVGWVAKSGRPLVLRSVAPPESAAAGDEPSNMTLALPITDPNGVIGVLAVESASRSDLDVGDMELIRAVTTAVGQMIGDVRSKEYSARKLTMLSALGEMGVAFTAATDRASLARLVAFCGGTVLEADMATVRILSETGDQHECTFDDLDLLAAHGTAAPEGDDPLGKLDAFAVERAIAARRPCATADLGGEKAGEMMRAAHVAEVLAVPLLVGDEVFGSVVVYRAAREDEEILPFAEQEQEIGTRLGDYAGAAAAQFTYWRRSRMEGRENAPVPADR